MDRSGSMRVQAEAAKALAGWKEYFAEQVAVKAKELAKASDSPGLITFAHYRQAAILAGHTLATEVNNTGSNDGRQEAVAIEGVGRYRCDARQLPVSGQFEALQKPFRNWPSAINPGSLGAGPQAPAKPVSNVFCVRLTSLRFALPVSTTYAEPIHPAEPFGILRHARC